MLFVCIQSVPGCADRCGQPNARVGMCCHVCVQYWQYWLLVGPGGIELQQPCLCQAARFRLPLTDPSFAFWKVPEVFSSLLPFGNLYMTNSHSVTDSDSSRWVSQQVVSRLRLSWDSPGRVWISFPSSESLFWVPASSESLFWVPSSGLVQVGFLITKPGNNNFEFQSL